MMTQEFETIVPVFLGDSADGDNRKRWDLALPNCELCV